MNEAGGWYDLIEIEKGSRHRHDYCEDYNVAERMGWERVEEEEVVHLPS